LSVAPGDPALVFELPVVNAGLAAKQSVSLSDLVGVLPRNPHRALVLHFFTSRHDGAPLQVLARIHKRYSGVTARSNKFSGLRSRWVIP
jgi:hypothetical protein